MYSLSVSRGISSPSTGGENSLILPGPGLSSPTNAGGVSELSSACCSARRSRAATSTPPSLWPSPPSASFHGGKEPYFDLKLVDQSGSLYRKVPLYLLAQYLGAFLGSAIVFLVYWDAIVFYEHDRGGYRVTPDTAAIFGTFPAHHLTLLGGLTDQLVATALLLLCICAITDRNNMKVPTLLLLSSPLPHLLFSSGQQTGHPFLHRPHHPGYRSLLWLQLWLRHQSR